MNKIAHSLSAALLLGCGLASHAGENIDGDLIARGKALAVASDCMACHTNTPQQGKPYAGGYGISSPMGTIYATNITPSVKYGIGGYSEAEFAAALRTGIRKDGAHLYPAMPYTAYTRLSDDEIHALYTYFMHGVAPVDEPAAHETALPFPFNIRLSMAAWNLLYLDNARFTPDPAKGDMWNEGAALVQGAAHCGTCHTPRNVMMAEDDSRFLAGAQLGSWYAPNITSDPHAGIGGWSEQELVNYLKTGRAAGRGQAAGPMAEAVEHSFQHLSERELRAIVTYLKTVPAQGEEGKGGAEGSAPAQPHYNVELNLRGANPPNVNHTLNGGEALYSGYCASCHQPDGSGSRNQAYPSLFNNSATSGSNPSNLIATILLGVDRQADGKHVLMPGFGEGSYVGELTDKQVADIANFVLQKYGNSAVSVTEADVSEVRAGGPKPLLARVQPMIVPGMVVGVIIVILLVIWWLRRRARR
ncbi:cytochrome c [Pluralibacter gergoviae]|uniref:cytochrome c n=1 Tax=Pluralibacter gergoviae TaxID=61647 RepID=UPI000650333F|nr:cytochrome c [Pluralibacter gergoviae]EKV0929116.1 cytochrome c [Pluralibacter gergoviae]EKV6245471.1 cytochrome c [Pluralibacter gergoviae]EKW9966617.1 cytochrome c [Pluralibacter gergoviae]ELD4270238.1 cytochrome c [Pluralibacter gergoviae]ELD4275218.1 cytochrome c [Pluralibacter gergoviae]